VVELASASGLTLIPPERRDPRRTSTYGFGQLLQAVRQAGVMQVIAGIGGSATNDGGAGMAQALGYRLLDAAGVELPRGGAALARLDRIDPAGFDLGWHAVKVMVACDVTNPLTGPQGASAVYGPQKGATLDAVRALDAALARFAAVIERDLGKRVADVPGAGAAGGTGAGLIAFLDATLTPGAVLVVDDTALPKKGRHRHRRAFRLRTCRCRIRIKRAFPPGVERARPAVGSGSVTTPERLSSRHCPDLPPRKNWKAPQIPHP
jgi:glycerate kinase